MTIGRPSRRDAAFIAICQALLIVGIVYVEIGGARRNLHTPLTFYGDATFFLTQSKSTMDNGWWWSNPRLGAPFVFDELAFPANANVDQALVFIVSRLIRDPIGAVTVTWVLMVALSGVTATWCMKRMGVSRLGAIVGGTLFAVCPYALFRNITHFCLVIYLVPFPCAAAWLLASGIVPDRRDWVLFGGLTLLGLDYIYYSFFACFSVAAAAVIGAMTYRDRRLLLAGGLCVMLIGGAAAINLAPSLRSWAAHGKPMIEPQKLPAEAERYGLKIRQLVTPVVGHPFPPFRRWADGEAAAGFERGNENEWSRLGIVGVAGFLLLLGIAIAPGRLDDLPAGRILVAAGRITLAALLLATVGGFGSVFSSLVTPEIRAYNRISPFIEFWSIAALVLALENLANKCGLKWRFRLAAAVCILALGLVDQAQASRSIRIEYQGNAAEIRALDGMVAGMERTLAAGDMVFQLPVTTFLSEPVDRRMQPYDHFKPYLVSRTLRWSYPALSDEQFLWQQAAAQIEPRRLARQVAAEGFSAILIDRYGYDDNGAAVESAVREGLPNDRVIARTDRYLALDVRALESAGSIPPLPRHFTPGTSGLSACREPAPLADTANVAMFSLDRLDVATPVVGPVHVRRGRPLQAAGWAVDAGAGAVGKAVDVAIDGTPLRAVYGVERPDVAAALRQPAYRYSGFWANLAVPGLGPGDHAVTIRVVSSGGGCYYETATPARLVID